MVRAKGYSWTKWKKKKKKWGKENREAGRGVGWWKQLGSVGGH